MRSCTLTFGLLAILVIPVLCLAGGLPGEFSGITDGHPDSTVVKVSRLPKVVRVEMKSGTAMAEIYTFYKTELTGQGWAVGVENPKMLVLTKGGKQFVVGVQNESAGNVDYTLMLR
jgi:hypothetical protein